jgi:hypothetical protein
LHSDLRRTIPLPSILFYYGSGTIGSGDQESITPFQLNALVFDERFRVAFFSVYAAYFGFAGVLANGVWG